MCPLVCRVNEITGIVGVIIYVPLDLVMLLLMQNSVRKPGRLMWWFHILAVVVACVIAVRSAGCLAVCLT